MPEYHIRNEIKCSVVCWVFFQLHSKSLEPDKKPVLLGSVATRNTQTFTKCFFFTLLKKVTEQKQCLPAESLSACSRLHQAPSRLSLLPSCLLHPRPWGTAAPTAACCQLGEAAGSSYKCIMNAFTAPWQAGCVPFVSRCSDVMSGAKCR